MIERYSRKEMACIWEPENRFQKWLDVEICACEAWRRLGRIPKAALDNIVKKARFDVKRIDEIEKTVKHDVIPFSPRLPSTWARIPATYTWGLPRRTCSIPPSRFF